MENNINLNRNVFNKEAFKKTVDTSFNELVSEPDPTFFDVNLATVDDFFILYNKFFYEIPQFGDINSHEYLIKTSSEYINFSSTNEEIQVLLDEIASLRQEILDIQLASIEDSDSNNNITDVSRLRQAINENANNQRLSNN